MTVLANPTIIYQSDILSDGLRRRTGTKVNSANPKPDKPTVKSKPQTKQQNHSSASTRPHRIHVPAFPAPAVPTLSAAASVAVATLSIKDMYQHGAAISRMTIAPSSSTSSRRSASGRQQPTKYFHSLLPQQQLSDYAPKKWFNEAARKLLKTPSLKPASGSNGSNPKAAMITEAPAQMIPISIPSSIASSTAPKSKRDKGTRPGSVRGHGGSGSVGTSSGKRSFKANLFEATRNERVDEKHMMMAFVLLN